MRKLAIIMAMALVLCGALAMSAQASFTLDFNIISPSNGTGTFAGGANPFIGTDIAVLNVVGLDTPLNAGVTIPITNGLLNFATGNFIGVSGPEFEFGTGGSFTITGSGVTLLQGSFIKNAAGEGPELEPGAPGPLFSADYVDVKNSRLAAFFGVPVNETGSINLRFNGALDVDGFKLTSLSGDCTNVPVPPTALLLGSGLLGLVGLRFRKNQA
jgi:hypothetical protein